KVSLNTSALARPELISEAAERFGSQCIVVAIDARQTQPSDASRLEPPRTSNRPPAEQAGLAAPARTWEVYTHGGRRAAGRDAVLAASIFHFGLHTVAEAKAYLRERGVEVRLEP